MITGANSGIGKSTAQSLAETGEQLPLTSFKDMLASFFLVEMRGNCRLTVPSQQYRQRVIAFGRENSLPVQNS